MSEAPPTKFAPCKSWTSTARGNEANITVEPSPLAASYRQDELIKLMAFFGFLLGIVAFIYNGLMELSLRVFWEMIPQAIEEYAAEWPGGIDCINRWGFMYTIMTSVTLAACAGMSIKYLGNPGDLPNVIECTHKLGYVPMKQSLPMLVCSLLSIAAGGSVGPEAPLVSLSASICGWISMNYFKHDMVMVRKCTIIGMSAGLSALFGVQLGGALFALEVLHTMGVQFFGVAIYAVGAGGVCLVVYRGLQGNSIGAMWAFAPAPQSTAAEVVLGALVGTIAGAVALFFRRLFLVVGQGVSKIGLGHFKDTQSPVILCALGGLCISTVAVLVPPTMFWSEFEIGTIAQPGKDLPHIWPQGGMFYGLERYPWESAGMYILVGLTKLLVIAFTVQSGFRGGFIFPLFFAGAAMGRALFVFAHAFLPPGIVDASPVLMSMCFEAGLNAAVTRTPFASPMILVTLSGQPNISAPALCAALVSLLVTRSSKFIGPQRDRTDLRFVGDIQPPQKTTENGRQEKGGTAADLNGHEMIHALMALETSSLVQEAVPTGGYSAVVGI